MARTSKPVSKIRRTPLVPYQPPEPSLMEVIVNALRDPKVDPAKMMQIVELQRELELDADRRAFTAHMSQLQSEISQIAADCANPQTNSKYASYYALDLALRPFYTAHGFSVGHTQEDHPAGGEWVRIVCIVTRGAWETRHHVDVKIDALGPKGNKVMTGTHAGASASTYGRRYSLAMAFNLVVSKDDDGNAAGARCITASQLDELHSLCIEAQLVESEVCEKLEIDSLASLPRNMFDKTKSRMLATRNRIRANG